MLRRPCPEIWRNLMSRSLTIRSLASPLLHGLLVAVAASLVGCTTSGPSASGGGSVGSNVDGFDEIIYAVRQNTVVSGKDVQIDVADGMGQVMDYGRYVPGARLEVRNLRTGDVRDLIDDKLYEKAD